MYSGKCLGLKFKVQKSNESYNDPQQQRTGNTKVKKTKNSKKLKVASLKNWSITF